MAATEGAFSFSAASVIEDILQQHGIRSRYLDMDSRKAEEAAIRRYDGAGWLRKMVGVVGAKDLPAEPSEEEFRLGLRSGLILCNVLNKVQPGAVSKVVESHCDSALIPDGAALSAYQYFENVRNFLVAAEELGLPTFDASDLEQGGKSARVVNCVLAIKSYSEWKQSGGDGVWKFGGNVKSTSSSTKQFSRKNSEPFTSSLSRNVSVDAVDVNVNVKPSSLSMLVRGALIDKKPEEVSTLVESVLAKVVEEFEQRMASQMELKKLPSKDVVHSHSGKTFLKQVSGNMKKEDKIVMKVKKDESFIDEELRRQSQKQQNICEQQQRDVVELKQVVQTTKASMKFMQMKFHEDLHNLGMHIHGLANAASGYHKVLEENRKLYNQVQDLKGSIRVYCRVRPFLNGQSNYLSSVDFIEEGTISISTPSKHGKAQKTFNFNKAFGPSATQAEVFSDTQQLIRSVLDGFNVCIFAYGQTGSGKTFTMSGPKNLTEESQGVNYRALGDLFLLAEQRRNTFRYEVFVQMIEIYNEQVRDLLVVDGLNKRLEIRNSSQTGLNVPDASLIRVTSTSDVIDLMNLGHKNRTVGATALNDRSSRSHSCVTVHVQGVDLTTGNILRGCMHLVDLAGSERVDKSEVTGDRLKEAQHINKSLSALGDVIASLAQKNSHVPYRNSKLTQLLQDSLGGQAKTLMFVHISPEPDAIGETISTLKFAERVATVELGAAHVNKEGSDVKELKEQIANLKAALARKNGGSDQKLTGSGSLLSSPYQQQNTNAVSMLSDPNSCRKSAGDLGNMEVKKSMGMRRKKQSVDLDELLRNSPPWPPVNKTGQNGEDEDKEEASYGEWVDKVMVNKQDDIGTAHDDMNNQIGNWEADNGDMSDAFYSKYLSTDTTSSYNIFTGRTEDFDEIEAGTSDSSEPDLLWQFNNAKLSSLGNGISPNYGKTNPKMVSKTPDLNHSLIPKQSPSPSTRKITNSGGQRIGNGRQVFPGEVRRKVGNKK
ncbi:kinesin-like protein KIN-14I [Impatiens glandulifera]|uniref:kinesin-like protein KIN-14I n=1 Tax=Impatiens glandulifera TaxID=253017 RepID=UPI001FB10494|nr:kinesin-like protein KIN-14I [Impatiens glandulifera]